MVDRLDNAMRRRGLCASRSQAENLIKLGRVTVDGRLVTKPSAPVTPRAAINISGHTYVGRAGLKLEAANHIFKLDFNDKTVLDAGASTGGFTDYALRRGAKLVYAVDVGSGQLHPSLRNDKRVINLEKTDIRDVAVDAAAGKAGLPQLPDIVLADLSFIGLRLVLPHLGGLAGKNGVLVVLFKPQFEAGPASLNGGVIKNDTVRRRLLKQFEAWLAPRFQILAKADSPVKGAKGNHETFYMLKVRSDSAFTR